MSVESLSLEIYVRTIDNCLSSLRIHFLIPTRIGTVPYTYHELQLSCAVRLCLYGNWDQYFILAYCTIFLLLKTLFPFLSHPDHSFNETLKIVGRARDLAFALFPLVWLFCLEAFSKPPLYVGMGLDFTLLYSTV